MPATTIAVLPFVNRSPDPENEFFCDGITEDIINALAKIEGLKVTSRTSSFFFKGKKLPLRQIAEELGVEVVLEGSVRLVGEDMRISTQLIQASDDFHFWSETWDRKFENLFVVQDEIALLIADKLREQFGHFEIGEHLVKRETEHLDAYSLALKARQHFNQWNPEEVRKAIGLWEQVVAIDPKHTESYVGLADAYGFMATTEFMPREEAWMKAMELTHKARDLDPNNAGVHYQLANLAFFTDCDFSEAFRHAEKAISVKPNYPEAQQFMAFLYILAGQMEQARTHLDRALSINPLSPETQFFRAYWHYRIGEYETALQLLEENLAHNPKNIPAYITRCYCLLMLGRNREVLNYLDQIPREVIVPDEKLGITCLAVMRDGQTQRANQLIDQIREKAQQPMAFQAHTYLFLALVNKGAHDAAFDWLEKSIGQKSSILLLSFSDPLANALRDHPRYDQFHRKLYIFPTTKAQETEKKSALIDVETAQELTQKLLTFVTEEEPYLNPAVTLRSLAAQVGVQPNQLSWLLNEYVGKNFNTFINQYRVEAFKRLATDPANAHISLIGLAYESGFNSKTVFNTYFKKETGMTPKAYLKAQQ